MKRHSITPRPDWAKIIESQGLNWYESDDPEAPQNHYWREDAYYRFTLAEIERLEAAVESLERMCWQAVEHVIRKRQWARFQIPAQFGPWIEASWERQDFSIYGRYDLAYDGEQIKLLEYNADTPTGLVEAAVVQWYWMQDHFGGPPKVDQWNSIHEALIEGWKKLRGQYNGRLHFASINDGAEDLNTATYLLDTAMQAGFETEYLSVPRIGWDNWRNRFTDEKERTIEAIFKLYPWEWLVRENFASHLLETKTHWVEPPWKMILSNKALLVVLHELYPGHPLLLPAGFDAAAVGSNSYVRKPQLGREGANTSLVKNGYTQSETGGGYAAMFGGQFVYQEAVELPDFDGHFPVLGAWVVNGESVGLGIREARQRITTNLSSFAPHIIMED